MRCKNHFFYRTAGLASVANAQSKATKDFSSGHVACGPVASRRVHTGAHNSRWLALLWQVYLPPLKSDELDYQLAFGFPLPLIFSRTNSTCALPLLRRFLLFSSIDGSDPLQVFDSRRGSISGEFGSSSFPLFLRWFLSLIDWLCLNSGVNFTWWWMRSQVLIFWDYIFVVAMFLCWNWFKCLLTYCTVRISLT